MINKMKSTITPLLALALLSMANISSACEIPEGWQEMTAETPGSQKAAIRLPSDTTLLGQPFDVELMTCVENSVSIKRVTVNATMPQHNHGMNYAPEITTISDNRYRASGMLFHMPGKWHITVEAHGANNIHRFALELSVK